MRAPRAYPHRFEGAFLCCIPTQGRPQDTIPRVASGRIVHNALRCRKGNTQLEEQPWSAAATVTGTLHRLSDIVWRLCVPT